MTGESVEEMVVVVQIPVALIGPLQALFVPLAALFALQLVPLHSALGWLYGAPGPLYDVLGWLYGAPGWLYGALGLL